MNQRTLRLQMFHIFDAVPWFTATYQLSQHTLADYEWRSAQVEPVEVKQVEDMVSHAICAARGKVSLQGAEVNGGAAGHDDFAIENQMVGFNCPARRPRSSGSGPSNRIRGG
jgi:hypothetical protein